MPLQGKVPFKRKIPKGVAHLDQELFFCKATYEVFTDYEELFDRAIQCSSLVWSCSLTGRGGLTFQEALESENRARKSIESIPWHLRRLLLMQVAKCKATRLQELSDKVFSLIHNRFVVGEIVEITTHGSRKTCEITDVRPPGSSTKIKSPGKSPAKKTSESPKKASPSKIRYEVSEKESEVEVLHVVSPDVMSRPKGALSKDKTKLFLRQSVDMQDGILKVKNSLTQKYRLDTESAVKKGKGEKSAKTSSPSKTVKTTKPVTPNKATSVKNALKNSQSPSKLKKTLKSIDADIRKMFPKNTKLSPQSKENNPKASTNTKDVKELKMEEEEEKKKREEIKKEQRRTENKLLNGYLVEWRKRREDLECDDLRDLPLVSPINCGIPRDSFGDAVAVMEFLHQFSSVLQLRSTFPNGFKLDLMEKTLNNTDIQGPFSDLLQLLLLAVFKQQDIEEEEPEQTTLIKEEINNFDSKMTTGAAVKLATAAACWSIQNLGCMIRRFPLDPFTLSELLRLHLLASGADISTVVSDRGGFKNIDDAGLDFKINNPALLEKLSTTTVFLLAPEERLKILTVLMEQLLSYPTFRDIMDNNILSLKKARTDLLTLYKKRRSLMKSGEPSNINERENDKDPETLILNTENGNIPSLTTKEPHVMTEGEKAELAQIESQIKDLNLTIHKILKTFRSEPFGSDRAHRNFWMFNSIDGLFVEDSNPYANQCLQNPTPTHVIFNENLSQDEIPLSMMNKILRIINNSHDKENNLSKSNKQNDTKTHQKMLGNLNGMSPLKASCMDKKKPGRIVFGMCTANPATCLVHGSNPNRISWGFLHDEKDLDTLTNGLNARGNREYNLKKNLMLEKTRIKDSMQKCPITRLNILEANNDEELVEQRKSSRIQADKSPFAGIHPEEALESALRDAILDNEEKIWTGGLGNMKIEDREAWRTAIENNSYDPQCDTSDLIPASALKVEGKCTSSQSLHKAEGAQVASTSHSTTPSSGLSPNIKDLAKAIVQLATCIQTRYIGEPLAAGYAFKGKPFWLRRKKLQKEEQNDEKVDMGDRPVTIPNSPMEKWKESLLSCSSLSQLFLHLITLENSITWHRSALKASCKICRKRSDAEKMLLCDKCDRGFHLYCLKPALEEVPSGDWFCQFCIPEKEVKKKNSKRRQTLNYKEVSEDEDDDEEEEEEENSENSSTSASDSEEEEPRSKRRKREKMCKVCRKGGELLCCENCSESIHAECVRPPLRRIPRGKWCCRKCLRKGGSGETSKNSRRKSTELLDVTSCEEILSGLNKHQDSWPFTKRQKGDLRGLVKRPVDLHSIQVKLKNRGYNTNMQFVADIYLMFQNREIVSSVTSREQEASKRLTRYFQTLLRRFKFEDANEVGDLIGRHGRRSY